MRIHIVSAGRNHHQWAERSIRSVLDQDVPKGVELGYTWIDDASEPQAWPNSPHVGFTDRRAKAWVNNDRKGGLANVYQAATDALAEEGADVLFNLGGDDWLLPGAIAKLAQMFADPECWVAYGSYTPTDPRHVVRAVPMAHHDYRNHPFVFMPLAWRAALTPKIRLQDLQVGGFWQQSSGDVALTLPLLEMAGRSRIRFNPQPLMVYNVHDQNDAAVDRRLQDFLWWYSRSRPRYGRLETLGAPAVVEEGGRPPIRDGLFLPPLPRHALVIQGEYTRDGTWQPSTSWGSR